MAEKKQIQLQLDQNIAKGTYVNLALIAHSSSEFVIDFAQMLPGMSQPNVATRVILAPEHAQKLLLALQDNIYKYEQTYGQIKINSRNNPAAIPFGSTGEA